MPQKRISATTPNAKYNNIKVYFCTVNKPLPILFEVVFLCNTINLNSYASSCKNPISLRKNAP